jgi:hypothetical protein
MEPDEIERLGRLGCAADEIGHGDRTRLVEGELAGDER